MVRMQPSRNHRSRRSNMKYVLQICLLLAICLWLIYQVKHSHDKRRQLDISNAKILEMERHADSILRFGRKDLPRADAANVTVNTHRKADEEEEDANDEDGNADTEERSGEKVDKESGDVAIDDHGNAKAEGELYNEEEFLDEEKEREDLGKREDGSKVVETDNMFQKNTREAREEQYKGDDASSAVGHEGGIQAFVPEKANQSIDHTIKELSSEDINGSDLNATTKQKIHETDGANSDKFSHLNATAPLNLDNDLGVYNSTDKPAGSPVLLLGNEGTVSNMTRIEEIIHKSHDNKWSSLHALPPELVDTSGNSSTSEISVKVEKFDSIPVVSHTGEMYPPNERERSFKSSSIRNETQTGEGPTSTDSVLSSNEHADDVQQDPIDSSDALILEHKTDGKVDLDTIAELQSKVLHDENAV